MARLASLLAAIGLAGYGAATVNGKLPVATKELITLAVVGLAGSVAPSLVRIPDPARAQLVGVVGTLIAAGLDLLVHEADLGKTPAMIAVGVITLGASLLVPATHLHNAPGVDRASSTLRPVVRRAGPEV